VTPDVAARRSPASPWPASFFCAELPRLADLDPGECRLGFDLTLETTTPPARVAEMLEPHLDADEFVIETPMAAISTPPPEAGRARRGLALVECARPSRSPATMDWSR
jgi:hypothetical protein